MSRPASRPQTPRVEQPEEEDDYRFTRYRFPVEHAEVYRPGGFHPVDVGDTFKDGQYEVLRKLGYGVFSTVWLAKDSKKQRLVAIKVAAVKSEETRKELDLLHRVRATDAHATAIIELVDDFEHIGPNGKHLCLVFELTGPSVASILDLYPPNPANPVEQRKTKTGERSVLPLKFAKRVIVDLVQSVHLLHEKDIVHGDLQFGNLLCSIKPILLDRAESFRDQADETAAQDEEDEGPGVQLRFERLVRKDGKEDMWAPKHLWLPNPLIEDIDLDADVAVRVSDFGGAFFASQPPSKTVTPTTLSAPELIFELPFGKAIDVWSIGCMIFELLTGVPLVSDPGFGFRSRKGAVDSLMLTWYDIFGPAPQAISEHWPRQSEYFASDGTQLRSTVIPSDDDLGAWDDSASSSPANSDNDSRASHDSEPSSPKEGADCDSDEEDEEDEPGNQPPLEQFFFEEKPEAVDADEAADIVDLLKGMLQYEQEKRLTLIQVLKHPWIQRISDRVWR